MPFSSQNLFTKQMKGGAGAINKQNGKKHEKWVLDPSKCLNLQQVKEVFLAAEQKKSEQTRSSIVAWMLVKLLFHTGLRVSEAAALNWENVVLGVAAYSHIFITAGKTKHSRRAIPLNSHIVEDIFTYKRYLAQWQEDFESGYFLKSPISGSLYNRESLYWAFRRVLENTSIQRKHPHIARHTYAINLYKKSGHNLRLVQELLGHSSVRISEIYTSIGDEDRVSATEKMYEEIYN